MPDYLRYVIKNIEPVRIADDSTSQNGQTVTLRYIPGTTIRGHVINTLINTNKNLFDNNKKELFSRDVRFMNAYLMVGDKEKYELLPSPKGFYEDKGVVKGKKKIQNVVIAGEFSGGYKRASLGRYCYIDNQGCIHYYNVDVSSDLKIKINLEDEDKNNVFRNEYITSNHLFVGYIAIENPELKEIIKDTFSNRMIIGNARSSGFGKCEVVSCEYVKEIPYRQYLPEKDIEKECYMMLLSNTVMRNDNGELCGINLKILEEKMGVKNLSIKYCSTSTVDVKGYNRTWGVKIPSALMFEQGSVFHFSFEETFKHEKMIDIVNQGLGIRINEGFGRVIFIKDYEKIEYKLSENYFKDDISDVKREKEDDDTLKIIAKRYYNNLIRKNIEHYIVNNSIEKGKASNSQLGNIESIAVANKYDPKNAIKKIKDYIEHTEDKENLSNVHKQRNSIKKLFRYINTILDRDLIETIDSDKKIFKEKIMGIKRSELLEEDEANRMKLELIIDMIRYDNKKGGE